MSSAMDLARIEAWANEGGFTGPATVLDLVRRARELEQARGLLRRAAETLDRNGLEDTCDRIHVFLSDTERGQEPQEPA